ncbi:GntR family transcriptional regulator [Streptomyces sp. NPDC000927]|uniref:GntR family transcriptional regulator n=1 Tax=Streptomyces sp. NPDC000927 TaxID=3154371 RepID=UPI0033246BAA
MNENKPAPASGIPRYQQIATYYSNQILSGALKPGDELPARHALMDLHGEAGKPLGRATADKVIDILSARGLIERRTRKAPIVADRSQFGAVAAGRAAANQATGSASEANETSRVLMTGMMTCPPDIAAHLDVELGEAVLRRSQVNYKNGTPATISTSYYTQEVAGLAPELSEDEPISDDFRNVVAERLGSPMGEGVEVMTSRLASDAERSSLMLPGMYSVVSQVIRVVSLEDGRVTEVTVRVSPGNRPLLLRPNA